MYIWFSGIARSASGYVDDCYMDSGEERTSFVCSKPGFVCLAAVLFTVSFISLAFFLETGMPWRDQQGNGSLPLNQVVDAAAGLEKKGREDTSETSPNASSDSKSANNSKGVGIQEESNEDSDGEKSPEVPGLRLQEPLEVIEAHESREPRPSKTKAKSRSFKGFSGVSTLRPLSPLHGSDTNDVLHIFTPFDDRRHSQARALRALMDSQGYGKGCNEDFTFHDLIEFIQIAASSESTEENNFECKDLSVHDFEQMARSFKNKMRRNSKYLFVVRDPRSLIYPEFDRHGGNFVNCIDNDSHRCLYDEEILADAQATMEQWNVRTQQMIELCYKLGKQSCKIILVERLIFELADTLESVGKFLFMDFEKDTFRILNKMLQKVYEGNVDPVTEKQRLMTEFLEFLLRDTSGAWPWTGKLPYNVFKHMPRWAPLMGKLGYGFTPDIPALKKHIVIEDLLTKAEQD
ncbi:protein-tyrosine sulfotransferase A-like [Tropilaelaps mercedesae]|uniref:Protein-tyrosine sulfotransferase A-like n=1 Tax=Tropilaelaps mercedesae TaxID=418985 RepID=A0A1V9XDG9_9ACAR|nr:protein-tyrosine sulfotransferase A-like [Tropilaelaps mercedesae]